MRAFSKNKVQGRTHIQTRKTTSAADLSRDALSESQVEVSVTEVEEDEEESPREEPQGEGHVTDEEKGDDGNEFDVTPACG
ncbi:hypothetical protein K491DRAFT_693228 [Lophiostoma macrostomum CBS 122681]|uniref:Uncharacterized protein n=1 Tax=Lophiostoma macrostomum CBS 122681 TaxID=1314788 RepID=A0A6A6T5X9_9PLEO|nr:hypothetical protein K491DRAFT_693228 [Lophiostoma macrostomum CBS 122681]